MATIYQTRQISPVDALWTLIQGQTKDVRNALFKRLLEQQKGSDWMEKTDISDFSNRIKCLEDDPEGFFKLGGFMEDSDSSAEELLEDALSDKYGF